MKIKISRNLRKYIIIYLALIAALYVVVEMVPRVTTIFETTQILEPGSLVLTDEATGYLIKTETIGLAPASGTMQYLVEDGTSVRKKQKIVKITEGAEPAAEGSRKLADLMEGLAGYDGLKEAKKAPISGICSLAMDGAEAALNPARMDALTYEKVKELPMKARSLQETEVTEGDPIYKVTADNRWYIACWLKKDAAAGYSEGQTVTLQLPAGAVTASIRSIAKEDDMYKIIFTTDRYYQELASAREVKMTIEGAEQAGLLVDNDCLIEKKGKEGVYVRDKNGDYSFTRVNVIETDGKESVIAETSYIEEETGETIYTVSVYDEVLKNPQKTLQKELKEEEQEKSKRTGG